MRSDSFVLTGLVLGAALLGACGKSEPAKTAATPVAKAAPRALIGTDQVATRAALFDTVSARALRGDTLGLARLLVDDSVFRRNVYRVSPAYDSTRESVFEFVLGLNKTNSLKGFKRLLHDAATAPVPEPIEVSFTDSTATPEGMLYVPTDYDGKVPRLQMFGAVLCRANGCQVVSYAPAGARGDLP